MLPLGVGTAGRVCNLAGDEVAAAVLVVQLLLSLVIRDVHRALVERRFALRGLAHIVVPAVLSVAEGRDDTEAAPAAAAVER